VWGKRNKINFKKGYKREGGAGGVKGIGETTSKRT